MAEQATRIKDQSSGDYVATRDAYEKDAETHSRVIKNVDLASRQLLSPPIIRGNVPVAAIDGVDLTSLPADLTSNLIDIGDKKLLVVNPEHLVEDGGIDITLLIFNAAGDTVLAIGETKSSIMGSSKFKRGVVAPIEGTFNSGVVADDGRVTVSYLDAGGTKIWFGQEFGDIYHNFLRFPNVNIPQGAVIHTAYVTFTARYDYATADCNVNIYLNDVDNAVAPADHTEFFALALTSNIAWNNVEAWVTGNQYNSPELKTILQSIVSRQGWLSGQAVQVVIKDNGSPDGAARYYYAFDNGSLIPELHITWSYSYVSPQLQWDISGAPKVGLHVTSISGVGNEVVLKGGVI